MANKTKRFGEGRKICDHSKCDSLATRTVNDTNGTLMLCPVHYKKFINNFVKVLEETREDNDKSD